MERKYFQPEIETMPREEIKKHQLEKLKWQVRRIYENVPMYKERMAQPYVMGRDLIQAGVRPSSLFSEALAYAHKMRLAGISKDDQLRQTLSWIRKEEGVRRQENGGE